MSVSLSVAGVSFAFPVSGESNWGEAVTAWATAVSASTFQKNGGTQALTAELDFGASFGTKHLYFKTRTSNPATAGQVRLARADVVSWRNEANGANLDLAVNSSNQLTFGGLTLGLSAQPTFSDTATVDLTMNVNDVTADVVAGSLTNTHINASAAIATSKLAQAVEIGYLTGVTSAIQTQLDTKLASSGGTSLSYVYNGVAAVLSYSDDGAAAGPNWDLRRISTTPAAADIIGQLRFLGRNSNNANIVYSSLQAVIDDPTNNLEDGYLRALVPINGVQTEIARFHGGGFRVPSVTASRAVVTDADSDLAASAVTATELGFIAGLSSAVQTQLNTKLTTGTAALVNADVNASAAIAVSKLAALTASRAVVTDGSGFLSVSAATATEVGYLSGVTSAIQTQLTSFVSGLTLLQVYSPAAVASVDITSQISATYDRYLLVFNLVPATDAADLYLRTDASNGASFDAGASDYGYHGVANTGTTTVTGAGSDAATQIVLTSTGVDNALGITGHVWLEHLGTGTTYPQLTFSVSYIDDNGTAHVWRSGSAARMTAAAINAVQILFSSGNITSGTVSFYGLRKTV